MTKVVIFAGSKKEVRDIYLSELIKVIPAELQLVIFTPDADTQVYAKTILRHESVSIIKFNKFCQWYSDFFAMVRLWRFRERTLSHYMRAVSVYGKKDRKGGIQDPLHYDLSRHFGRLKRLVVRVFASSLMYSLLVRVFKLVSWVACKDLKLPDSTRIAIVPYLGSLSGNFDLLISTLKMKEIICISFQCNWDNLSSKTFMHVEPDFFAVWGKQSEEHLRWVQRNSVSKVVLAGSPRFSRHYKMRSEIMSFQHLTHESSDHFRIFFAGDGIGSNDLEILESILKISSRNIKVTYRPHPFSRNSTSPDDLVRKYGERLDILKEDESAPELNYLDSLKNSHLIITQYSTLCLEALILRVPVLIPTFRFSDKEFNSTQYESSFHHLSCLSLIDSVNFVRTFDELRVFVSGFEINTKPYLTPRIDWICKETNFAQKIYSIVQTLI